MIPTDLLFLLSSRQGAIGSGKTLLPSHLFAPLVQVWVVQTRETNWFCSAAAAGLSICAEHSEPFRPGSTPAPSPAGARWTQLRPQLQAAASSTQVQGRGHGPEPARSFALQPPETSCARCPSPQNSCKMCAAFICGHGRNCTALPH